jgi:hypothetical protein
VTTDPLADFPWVDPDDTGYEVEPYEPETDVAPAGGAEVCSGHATLGLTFISLLKVG